MGITDSIVKEKPTRTISRRTVFFEIMPQNRVSVVEVKSFVPRSSNTRLWLGVFGPNQGIQLRSARTCMYNTD